MTKVEHEGDAAELAAAVYEASRHDWRILVEQGIDAREIECAVLCPKAGEAPQASWPGEIVLDKRAEGDDQFYDFDSKYMDAAASHVDTFVTKDGKVMVNEINTMPGFTSISMYPKAWEATGVRYTDLITMLIEGVLR